jgi:hypothetical protein
MIAWGRGKRDADDVALLSKDAAGLAGLLPNKLEADQLLVASEGQCRNVYPPSSGGQPLSHPSPSVRGVFRIFFNSLTISFLEDTEPRPELDAKTNQQD